MAATVYQPIRASSLRALNLKEMTMARKSTKLKIPATANEKLFRRAYASTVAKRRRLFNEDVERSLLVNKLKTEALAKLARAAKVRSAPTDAKEISNARGVLRKLRPLRPILPDTPQMPVGVISAPYHYVFPSESYKGAPGIFFKPLNGSPNGATGQVGSDLGSYTTGQASVRYDVGDYFFLQTPGTYRVTATANVSGFYYIMSPGYQLASVSLALNVWADDYTVAPGYMPSASTSICGEGFFFGAGRDWNYISGQYQASVTFPAGDAPTYYAIGAGTTQTIMAGLGCIAALDAATTIQSISVELIG
jgi:hypothetical protein